ncbi:hypothetical protein Pmar_PMAR023205 [Perkinsus marinus ATCC 50983]|uniref:Uncharacterized protein n=1 Tax=Perkinsus marinus (strain ATCC 50983 / TXsc) TaxID=423536 RepID=C5LJG5_PERM5|nr:hypothetical protein Pmar_PMAR023205 [Perkinsus marinus ATCC 50983]EER03094.1 hypothetical protein Pmar_PMAR023205 [Perkinsus marinus ATCC 50983]|eukprot:XP_002771278.1 hypothetical protein Pmar_PMAR023205 [Perkinsus marinus ATCC 50983]
MSRIYNIDFDLPEAHESIPLDDTKDATESFHTSKVLDRSLSLLLDMEDFWTPLRWQSAAEPPVKMLKAVGKKPSSSTSVDLIGLFDSPPSTRQDEDIDDGFGLPNNSLLARMLIRTDLSTKETVEMWFPRHPHMHQMPLPVVEPPLSLLMSISSSHRRTPLPRLDEPLIPVLSPAPTTPANRPNSQVVYPYDPQSFQVCYNNDLRLELDILEPLRPVKGLDLNDFYRLIEDTSTPSTSSMWHTVNPVYKMMTTLKLLIEGLDDPCLRSSSTTKKRRIDDDLSPSPVVASGSSNHLVCTRMDDDLEDLEIREDERYQDIPLEMNSQQPHYFDYDDPMTGISYISLADEIEEMHPLISELSSHSPSEGGWDVDDVLEDPPCTTIVPYRGPPVPIGGWAIDYLAAEDYLPHMMISGTSESYMSTSGSSDESSTITIPSQDEHSTSSDEDDEDEHESISDLSLESEESIYIAESTDTDDPDASLECMTEVSECVSSFTEDPREPLKLTPIAGRVEIGSSSRTSGGFVPQRHRQDFIRSMTAWLSEIALERERQAMAVCDDRRHDEPAPAESCTQIQVYRGGGQVETPVLRYREELGDAPGYFGCADYSKVVSVLCRKEHVIALPYVDSTTTTNTTLALLDYTDLDVYEPGRLAIPSPLGYGYDELDIEDLDCDTEQSDFDDGTSPSVVWT